MKKTMMIMAFMLLAIGMQARCHFDPEKYVQEQKAYILSKVEMTPEQVDVFYKIFNDMRAKDRALTKEDNKVRKSCPSTDEEAMKAIKHFKESSQRKAQVFNDAVDEMVKFLPASVVYNAMNAAYEYDRKSFKQMAQKMKDKKNQNQNKKPEEKK